MYRVFRETLHSYQGVLWKNGWALQSYVLDKFLNKIFLRVALLEKATLDFAEVSISLVKLKVCRYFEETILL